MAEPRQKSILLINGPNLNLLGVREPDIYGTVTLEELERSLREWIAWRSIQLETVQSNHEGLLLDAIHAARGVHDAIVINPGAYAHTSIALRDALTGVGIPFVEVHISNIHRRESFRHHSYLSDQAEAVISGLGIMGYRVGLEYFVDKFNARQVPDSLVFYNTAGPHAH